MDLELALRQVGGHPGKLGGAARVGIEGCGGVGYYRAVLGSLGLRDPVEVTDRVLRRLGQAGGEWRRAPGLRVAREPGSDSYAGRRYGEYTRSVVTA